MKSTLRAIKHMMAGERGNVGKMGAHKQAVSRETKDGRIKSSSLKSYDYKKLNNHVGCNCAPLRGWKEKSADVSRETIQNDDNRGK